MTLELMMVPRQGLEVTPALVSFAELLMLPYETMQAVIDDELVDNDALERLEPDECPICRGMWSARCPVCSVPVDGFASGALTGDWSLEGVASESDAETLLRSAMMETDGAHRALLSLLIDCIDDHGMLDCGCAELAAELGVDASVVTWGIDIIRRAGPPGIAATSVAECLLLQLAAVDLDDDLARLAEAVIADHLPALAKGHFAAIGDALGVTATDVRRVLDLIRDQLRPYPDFGDHRGVTARYVVPDVVVRRHDEIGGELIVDLVEPAMTRLAVRPRSSAARASVPSSSDAAASRARSFVAQLQDRWTTLRRVVECVVEHHKAYLVGGAGALVPLTRAEVAAEVGLHESTVSRAVADKYALLPDRTVVPLSRFFGARGGIDEQLRELVAAAGGPISDRQLADRLTAAGFPIARRTVAKHRARLGIASTLAP